MSIVYPHKTFLLILEAHLTIKRKPSNQKQAFEADTRELQGKLSIFWTSPSNITNIATLVASLTLILTLYLEIKSRTHYALNIEINQFKDKQ